ncbi:MAG TPA: ChaN family lipoprotein [Polyangiaceae bacterium]|nr:ChaN family lipoprotein [Polyangiaceae bacterium]
MRPLIAFISCLPCFIACARAPVAKEASSAATSATTTADVAWTSALDRAHILVGRIWDVAARRFVDERTLTSAVVAAPLVVLGEQHDNADHHVLEARLIGAMSAAGRRPALVAEMLDETVQPKIDEVVAAHPKDAEAFARAVDWEHSGWPAWSLYRPVFARALGAGLPIVAAGLERERTMTIAHDGLAAVDPAVVRTFDLAAPVPADVESALESEMREAHCGLLPESMLAAMALIQRVRDAVMATHLTDATHSDGAVLVAGDGHARSDRGVPALVARSLHRRVLAVGLVEVRHDWTAPEQYGEIFSTSAAAQPSGPLPFDYAWFTPRASDADRCAELRSRGHQKNPKLAAP